MLVSLANIKTYLALDTTTYDDLLTLLEGSAVSFLETYCNNKILEEDVIQYFDGDDALYDNLFFLNNTVNITDFEFYEEVAGTFVLVSADDYDLNDKGGILTLNTGIMEGKHNYKAVYTCGYDDATITNDLKIAILKIIGKYYNKHKSDGLSTESLDGASINFDTFMSDDIKLILMKYKITVI